MHGFPRVGAKQRLVAAIVLVLVALPLAWLGIHGWPEQTAADFEECAEQVEAKPASDGERKALMTGCNARFAGRRKVGGGYSYYDFMQDRKFDIAGPNPTAEERQHIDHAYMGFLDAQRREAVSAQLAKRKNEQLRADMEIAAQPVGPPLVLKPTIATPLPVKRPLDRSKPLRCEDSPLSCSWAKFPAAVKDAFASSPTPSR
jgi:hypothetical protein